MSGDLHVDYGSTLFMCILYITLAISYILVGTGRLSGLLSGRITVPISIYDCFYHRYWPQSLILGTELPALGTILISIERICAVLRPGIYNRIFTNSRKLLILSSLPAWAVVRRYFIEMLKLVFLVITSCCWIISSWRRRQRSDINSALRNHHINS
ncbi:hypothetical protein WR25_01453 isoform B [Diploscapter pachys]|uniref:Uncharacterized protein n=1 Tax=Diploscapter pachys TaxID=2018661 RepID=A0A2A2LU32_9BILA|nr:hypothetical protein WR25_01453 isoform B [Diploscapter pachys]